MTDPRIAVIDERLKHVKRIIAVSSGKGGVGKTLVACSLASALVRENCKVGLFDLDFTSPTSHVVLDIEEMELREEKGLIPATVYGFEYVSIVFFSGAQATPLRGADISNVLIELLAITRWGKLDCLIIDMPPGIGDAQLDLIRLIKRIEFFIVTTPSPLAFETVRKLSELLKELQVPVVGILENMQRNSSKFIRGQAKKMGLRYLACIPFDERVEETIGDFEEFLKTNLAKKVQKMAKSL